MSRKAEIKKLALYAEAERQGRNRLETKCLANTWAVDADRLGTKLLHVREVAERATSEWSRRYWRDVERQLLRKIQGSIREFA